MAPTSQQPRVFVSHSSRDKPFVRRLTGDLKQRNLTVWFDEQELGVGDSIVQGVSAGLKDTDYFVLVISENSLQSKWVQQESNSALMSELSGKGVVVLPIRIDDAPIPPLLTDRIYADFRTDLYALGFAPAMVKRSLYLQDPSVGASRQPALLPDKEQDEKILEILRRYQRI